MNLLTLPRYLQSTVFGRQVILSYPKSGRTWIMNLFANYLVQSERPQCDPVSFITRVEDPYLRRLFRRRGLIFSHGAIIERIRERKSLEISPVTLRHSKITFLVRNPVSLLVSFYYHGAHKVNSVEGKLADFALGQSGCEALSHYYNQVLPNLARNARAHFVQYESLHQSAPNRFEALRGILAHHLGSINEEAFNWAVSVCEFPVLKARAQDEGKSIRVRQGAVDPEDGNLTPDLSQKIWARFYEGLEPNVQKIVRERIGWHV